VRIPDALGSDRGERVNLLFAIQEEQSRPPGQLKCRKSIHSMHPTQYYSGFNKAHVIIELRSLHFAPLIQWISTK